MVQLKTVVLASLTGQIVYLALKEIPTNVASCWLDIQVGVFFYSIRFSVWFISCPYESEYKIIYYWVASGRLVLLNLAVN